MSDNSRHDSGYGSISNTSPPLVDQPSRVISVSDWSDPEPPIAWPVTYSDEVKGFAARARGHLMKKQVTATSEAAVREDTSEGSNKAQNMKRDQPSLYDTLSRYILNATSGKDDSPTVSPRAVPIKQDHEKVPDLTLTGTDNVVKRLS